ncbi:MarR family winged helix-turn-helix transcriptional regulator [Polaribacter tangerinus]|uniref:MarR family winged helix-turn-helix transcriptional regulator n=1 Tax=Polaribacter tangerinus TaxID=1920034 RepID=UPI000B4AD184|nr:MarR family transcriptional regulator [Polaribacter tangerinus]
MGDISNDIKSKFKNEKIKAYINLKYTANWLNSKENEFFKPYGISPQQYNILRILRGAKKEMKVQVIKERMIERSPNATRLMDKLFEKKYIKRSRCKHDRRVVYVSISKEGLAILEEIDVNKNLEYFENLTSEEATILSDLLDKIR